MNLKFDRLNKKGFSLLEMTVVIIVATILASQIIPQYINGYAVKAANKTALDMSAIQEASRAYYIKNNAWPGTTSGNPLGDLTAGNYLPTSWQAINPFGFGSATPATYSYNFSLSGAGNGAALVISTYIPNATAQTVIKNLLPTSWVDSVNKIVNSSISVPGTNPPTMPSGAIIIWPATVAPAGYVLCDGSVYNTSSYPSLASLYGSAFGGNGSTTFGVPDCRGRGIIGLNPLTTNDGTPRVWSMDNYSNNLGQAASYTVNQIGGVFGEEKHRQTVVEMAPHTHSFSSWDYVKGFSGNSTTSPRDPQGGQTGSAGGNGDGTGLGAAANVVQPSVAMNYIIKT